MTQVPLIFPYNKNAPIFGVSFEVPNQKPPSIAAFSILWSDYVGHAISVNNICVVQCSIPAAGISGSGLDMVKSVFVDNSSSGISLIITAKDTGHKVYCGAYFSGWFAIMTNQFNFDVSTVIDQNTVTTLQPTPTQIFFCNTVIPPNVFDTSGSTSDIIAELAKLDTDLLNFAATNHSDFFNQCGFYLSEIYSVELQNNTLLQQIFQLLNNNLVEQNNWLFNNRKSFALIGGPSPAIGSIHGVINANAFTTGAVQQYLTDLTIVLPYLAGANPLLLEIGLAPTGTFAPIAAGRVLAQGASSPQNLGTICDFKNGAIPLLLNTQYDIIYAYNGATTAAQSMSTTVTGNITNS